MVEILLSKKFHVKLQERETGKIVEDYGHFDYIFSIYPNSEYELFSVKEEV